MDGVARAPENGKMKVKSAKRGVATLCTFRFPLYTFYVLDKQFYVYTVVIPSPRTIAASVLAALLLGVTHSVHAAFFDVPSTHPYFDAINYLKRRQIIHGYINQAYKPDVYVNRAEFTKILTGMIFPESDIFTCIADVQKIRDELPEDSRDVIPAFNFPDVPHNAWFAPYVCSAWVNGIISGYPDGLFRPEEGVQFAEAAKMLAIGFGLTGVELPNLGSINALWYTPYVEILSAKNAIPLSIKKMDIPINRGEMAEMLYRLRNQPVATQPAQKISKSTEDVVAPVRWVDYENKDYSFSLQQPSVWPEPLVLPRGYFDGRAPYTPSEWTVYFGEETDRDCSGRTICVARDIWIDGYKTEFTESVLDAVFYDEDFITLLEEPEINNMPSMVILEEVGSCIDKRAFIFGDKWIYAINFRCGGEDDKLYNFFDQFIRTFEEIKVASLSNKNYRYRLYKK